MSSMVGGLAATAAIRTFPFRIFSFPTNIAVSKPSTVRFIRAFDPIQSRFISRWDALQGFNSLSIPQGIYEVESVSGLGSIPCLFEKLTSKTQIPKGVAVPLGLNSGERLTFQHSYPRT